VAAVAAAPPSDELTRSQAGAAPGWLALALRACEWLPLIGRRRWPGAMLLASYAAFGAYRLLGYPQLGINGIAAAVLLYALGAYGHCRWTVPVGLVAVVPAPLLLMEYESGSYDSLGEASASLFLLGLYVVYLTAWGLGRTMRRRRSEAALLRERTALLERIRTDEVDRAVADERARIARDLHDVVTHHVSMMVIQSGAGRLNLDEHPDVARQTFAAIERLGAQALDDLRHLLGVLGPSREGTGTRQEEPDDDTPPALIERIEHLADRLRDAGIAVDIEATGPGRELPPDLDAVVHRVVQESFTNIARHSGANRVTVRLAHAADVVDVNVTDNGRGAASGLAPGRGLAGMDERVSLAGGELWAGPVSGEGFQVRVRLPVARGGVQVGRSR
jgi:signal transduction histidine kinase